MGDAVRETWGRNDHFLLGKSGKAARRKRHRAGPLRALEIEFFERKTLILEEGKRVRKSPEGEDPRVGLGNSKKEMDFKKEILDSQAGQVAKFPW